MSNTALDEAIKSAHKSIQPLVFETGAKAAPYGFQGTTFVVGFAGRGFVVTSRHTLNPDRPPPLCIFPSDGSRRVLPLKHVTYVPRASIDDEFADLAVIEIDRAAAKHPSQRRSLLINLDVAVVEREFWLQAQDFFVIGYPDYKQTVDYDRRHIDAQRHQLRGTYAGVSELPYLHKLQISQAKDHPSFSGWSGSPVFAWLPQHRPLPQLALCGVAVVGSPDSSLVQFVDVGVLLALLELACSTDPGVAQ